MGRGIPRGEGGLRVQGEGRSGRPSGCEVRPPRRRTTSFLVKKAEEQLLGSKFHLISSGAGGSQGWGVPPVPSSLLPYRLSFWLEYNFPFPLTPGWGQPTVPHTIYGLPLMLSPQRTEFRGPGSMLARVSSVKRKELPGI